MPESLQSKVLGSVHEMHTGKNKMKAILRGYCYWSGMNKDVENYVHQCIYHHFFSIN